jgi:hypothetical protein
MIILKEGKIYFGSWFQGSSPWSVDFSVFGLVVEAYGRTKLILHGDLEVRRKRDEGNRFPKSPPRCAPSDLISSY